MEPELGYIASRAWIMLLILGSGLCNNLLRNENAESNYFVVNRYRHGLFLHQRNELLPYIKAEVAKPAP